MQHTQKNERIWWKEGIVYQIYPRSYMDSNGDGIGDLPGILEKLDYIEGLGVDIIWLNPVYKSPNADMGYDISDYYDIMDEFGSLADWDKLLEGLHRRGIRLVMDLVVNHTSDEHPWFIESRSSRDNPYRDYYIWRPPKGGREPNNWESHFSGPAWTYDARTGEYYLHLFDTKQPDLNWENPRLRSDIFAMMRWWLDRGIDGFRMDTINMLSKVPGLPSVKPEKPGEYRPGHRYFMNGPRIHEFLQEMQEKAIAGYDAMTVGETSMVDPELALQYTGGDKPEMSMLFQFDHMLIDRDPAGDRMTFRRWGLPELKKIIENWQITLHGRGWNSNYLTNHDQPRAVSRFGNDRQYRVEAAKLLAVFTLTLEGTPYIYQGEEIGMTNVSFDSIDQYRDVDTLNHYHCAKERGLSDVELFEGYRRFSRDNARTPMQWDRTENAGFTSGTPWIEVNPNYKDINVRADLERKDSVIRFYRQLIRLRKSSLTLIYGGFRLLDRENPQVFAYLRRGEDLSVVVNNDGRVDGDYLVILNFSDQSAVFRTEELEKGLAGWSCILGNYAEFSEYSVREDLRPWEARIYGRPAEYRQKGKNQQ
ncbi:MAG: alpha-glucosidase [Spirochaetales bacterium]|nr:alpha-glucosidase [Spirochaetales bacterium]MCF7939524.1 alpha-glucosidase [Spirochaetales bacterium]